MAEPEQLTFEFDATKPIKGFPEIWWKGKHPYTSTQYFPAQKKERYGTSKEFVDKDGRTKDWINKIFWGDNIQVMSHLLKEFRGKVDLIYIDPPFDSKADYKKTVKLKGKTIQNDQNSFEQKQYGDIWSNDEYLQFMYERLILCRELLSDTGSIYLHCDYHRNHHLRMLLEEVFGVDNFINEIVWKRRGGALNNFKSLGQLTDTIFLFSKNHDKYLFNSIKTKTTPEVIEYIKERFIYDDGDGRKYSRDPITNPSSTPTPSLIYEYKGYAPPEKVWAFSKSTMEEWDAAGKLYFPADKTQRIRRKTFLDEYQGQPLQNFWGDIYVINSQAKESLAYPTQKSEDLLERILSISSNPGDLVFDCFMGSGTTQAVAMKLGRRFIGADINLGSIQTTTKRLCGIQKDIESSLDKDDKFTGFEVYNVNNYDFFQNPVQAKELLIEALEMQKFDNGSVFDGEKYGYNVKILPVNRIATKADLEELKANLPFKTYAKRKEENPNEPVDKIMLVCMGHEPDLAGSFQLELSNWKFDIKIYDILLPENKQPLLLKRDSEAFIKKEGNKLVIKSFYPMNLMQKLSLEKEKVDNWKLLTESVMIDWNYDGAVMEPTVMDVPEKNGLVSGVYEIPANAGRIMVKITDLLSESLEVEVEVE